jgi:hypothetical protein
MRQFASSLRLLGATAIFALSTAAASAATCSIELVTYTLEQGSPDGVLAHGCFAGNDTNTIEADEIFLGGAGWTLGDKTDGADGTGLVTFASFSLGPGYSWSVDNPYGYSNIMITLKQGPSFSAFVLDTTRTLAGTWFTEGPGDAEGDLSHASVYYAGPPQPIPLPAAAWLLLASMGGLVAASRKGR